ncbi:MAG: FAD binding domain-containing protein [Burkholderiales bacterium]
MYAFQYRKAKSLKEAGELLAKDEDAKPLSGGMTLIPTLKARLAQPTQLIDIAGLAELAGIDNKGGVLTIGAATRHQQVASSKVVKDAIPALAALASGIADPQVRNRGTIGGSVANNDPAADYPSAVLALNAKVITNKREIAADDFFQGMFTTALEAGELIVKIAFPLPKKAAYAKFPHPASGYAMAGVFIADTGSGVRVAVTGAGASGVFRWKEAEQALAKGISAAAIDKLTLSADDINEDMHGTREYRAQLVKVMAGRAAAAIAGK